MILEETLRNCWRSLRLVEHDYFRWFGRFSFPDLDLLLRAAIQYNSKFFSEGFRFGILIPPAGISPPIRVEVPLVLFQDLPNGFVGRCRESEFDPLFLLVDGNGDLRHAASFGFHNFKV